LNDRKWSRPLTNGSYPSPKAASSMITHNDSLILLYGGYSHPYHYTFNRQVNFFDEFHEFDSNLNKWNEKTILGSPKLAGHSASIINNNQMILFGGCNTSMGNKTNDIHCLNFVNNNNSYEWLPIDDSTIRNSPKPDPRYGHSQLTLDNERILIMGGCGGPNKQYDDIWILHWPLIDSTKEKDEQQLKPRWEKVFFFS
jgi:F-box protein 42